MREDWVECRLIDICLIRNNLRKPINSKERAKRIENIPDQELYPYYGATGKVGMIDDYLSDGTYILLGEDAAPFLDYTKDVAYLIHGKCWVNNHAHVLESLVSILLVKHYLNQFNFKDFVTGTTRLKLTKSALQRIPFPLPPLPEQRAIVTKLENLFTELDAGVASLTKAKAQLKIYRQAVLKQAFEGELTREWREAQTDLPTAAELLENIQVERERYHTEQVAKWEQAVQEWEAGGKVGKKPGRVKKIINESELSTSEIFDWPFASILSLLSLKKKGMTTGPFGTALKKSEHKASGVPVLGIENIGEGKFVMPNKIFVTEEKAKELNSFEVEFNDILISRSGTVGEICRVSIDIGRSLLSTNLIRISLNNDIISPIYFVYLFQGGLVREQVKKLCKGSTRDFLNQTILKSIDFPLPSLPEQHQIVQEIESRLSVCDRLEADIEINLQKAESLRQSLLKRAFAGALLTPEELAACRAEADWEPAGVLLGRIKGEG